MLARRLKLYRPLGACAALLAVSGCSIRLWPDDSSHGSPTVAPTTITVKAVNQTGKPLDPQLYVGPISDGLNNLFVAANKRTDFGVGGVGILTADTNQASFVVACEEGVFIGTRGGIYGDDLTAPVDQGRQVVLEEGLNVGCGDLVVFRYSLRGQELITSFAVEPLGQ